MENLKKLLDVVWGFLQIIALLLGGYWGISQWQNNEYQKLEPRTMESITGLSFKKYENDSVCGIGALWSIENKGEVPVEISNIKYSIYSVPYKNPELKEGEIEDSSMIHAIENDGVLMKSDIILLPKHDVIVGGGTISRDILFRYKPKGNFDEWFNNNRISILVEAELATKRGTIYLV